VLLAGTGALTLLLLLSWLLLSRESTRETIGPWAVVLMPCFVVIVLAVLYGKGSACPRCRKWWRRTQVGSEFVDRKFFDKNGVPIAMSSYRTVYQCLACGHRWSVVEADECQEPSDRLREYEWR
jgi:hypothetical protein